MLDKATVVGFAATTNAEAAREFYGERLGLTLLEDSPFALVFSAGATRIRVQRVRDYTPPGHTVLGWEVADISATVRGLTERGVEFLRVDGLPQDEHGVWTTPDGSRVAWFRDPDGSILSLSQHTS